MTSTPACRTQMLGDEPADEDALGQHASIAAGLEDLVRNQSGGKAIALEGEWGSGKSSIIRMLQKRLAGHTHIRVWVFDAWAHEGDPLRRSFLQRLRKDLPEGWPTELKRKEWDERSKVLAGRVVETSTKSVNSLAGLGLLAAVLALLVPLTVPAISAAFHYNQDDELNIKLGLLLLGLFPWAGVALGFLAFVLARKSRSSDPKAGPSEGILSLLSSQTTQHAEGSNYQSNEPSSVEFEELFDMLMANVLDDDRRRLVIVLDNLDRVTRETALKAWSTLQAFLRLRDAPHRGWAARLWVVVPFNPAGVSRVFSAFAGETAGQGSASTPDMVDSFLAKTFQISITVPPPVLANWTAYFKGQFTQAFPMHAGDFEDVRRVVALTVGSASSPSPRWLKTLLNEMVTLHGRWSHDYSLPELCYFALCRRVHGDLRSALALGNVPAPQVEAIISGDLRGRLASMYYNAPVEQAEQLLLNNAVKEALIAGQAAQLKQMAAAHPRAIVPVIAAVLPEGVVTDAPSLLSTALALDESGVLAAGAPARELADIRSVLLWAGQRERDWGSLDSSKVVEVLALLRRCDWDAALLRSIVGALFTEGMRVSPAQQRTEAEKHVYVSALGSLLESIPESELMREFPDGIDLPVAPNAWVELCLALSDRPEWARTRRLLRPSTPYWAISDELWMRVGGPSWRTESNSVFESTLICCPGIDLSSGAHRTIDETIAAPPAPAQLAARLSALWMVGARHPQLRADLQTLIESHLFWEGVDISDAYSNETLVPLLLLSVLSARVDPARLPKYGDLFGDIYDHPETPSSFVGNLARLIVRLDLEDDILVESSAYPRAHPLIAACRRRVANLRPREVASEPV